MTDTEILALTVRCAKEVMGWEEHSYEEGGNFLWLQEHDDLVTWCPAYNMGDAWDLVDAMAEKGFLFELRRLEDRTTAQFLRYEPEAPWYFQDGVSDDANTHGLAIMLAAIAAVEEMEKATDAQN